MIVVVGVNHRDRAARGARGPRVPEGAAGRGAAARARGGGARRGDDPLDLQPRGGLRPRAAEARARRRWPAFLARFHGRAPEELAPHLYRLEGEAAVRHAFRVAASLDSMVIGEPQILGQVKEAYQAGGGGGHPGLRPERAAQPLARRGEARAHGDRHRPQRGLGLPRRGGAGAQDLRRPARQERAAGRRGQDERAGRAPAGAGRRARHGARRAHVREGRASWPPRWAAGPRPSRRCATSWRAPTS